MAVADAELGWEPLSGFQWSFSKRAGWTSTGATRSTDTWLSLEKMVSLTVVPFMTLVAPVFIPLIVNHFSGKWNSETDEGRGSPHIRCRHFKQHLVDLLTFS